MSSFDPQTNIRRFFEKRMTSTELADFARRIQSEPDLRHSAAEYLVRFRGLETASAPDISHEMLCAYVEGSLDRVDVEFVEALAEIEPAIRAQLDELRANRVQLSGLDASFFSPTRAESPGEQVGKRFFFGRWRLLLASGATATLLVVFFLARLRSHETSVGDVAMIPPEVIALATGSDRGATLATDEEFLLDPVATAVESDRPRMTWQPVKLAASYRLTMLDEAGEVVFRGTTSNSSLTLDRSLPRGKTYSWFVSALTRDGADLETLASARIGDKLLSARFIVLSAHNLARFEGALRSASPNDSYARANIETAFGLLETAESELTHIRAPVPSATRLLTRIRARSNGSL
jgi:hypothetical protein